MMRSLSFLLLWLMAFSTACQGNITNGLAGWWLMNEGDGTVLSDLSGNGNTGTLYNSPAWITGHNGSPALSFTATSSSYVEIADSASLNLTNRGSICFWAKFPTHGIDKQGIVTKGDAIGTLLSCYGFASSGAGTYDAILGSDIGSSYAYSTGLFPSNTWLFVCTTWDRDAGALSVYMNAVLLPTTKVNSQIPSSSGYPLRFGANGSMLATNFFDGALQDVRVYNRELSASEVANLYTDGGGAPWYLPDGYLASIAKPSFAVGTTLPHLTYWGQGNGAMSSNAVIELAKNWYYCLSLSGYATPTVASNTAVVGTFDWAMANMAKTNSKYKLSVLLDRTFTNPPAAFYCTNSSGTWVTNDVGNPVQTVCPEGDLQGAGEYWTNITAYWINDLKAINSNGPISVILNGGEYGLVDSGYGWQWWPQDPRVQSQSVFTDPFWNPASGAILDTNGMSWNRYSSYSKARQVGYLTKSINENFPSRELSIFYHTGWEAGRTWANDSLLHQYWVETTYYGWLSDYMNTNTDLPSFQLYYPEDGWFGTPAAEYNLLTRYLNAVGYGFTIGYTNNYSWISAGWSTTDLTALADIFRYTGLLKCLYTAGMRGAVAGYFSLPPGGKGWLLGGPKFDAPFPADSPPHWLQQLIQLSRVHAQFSYLDSFTTNSSLISGPQVHALSQDQPAYEFTNTAARANSRVLARKHDARDEWLVCAWAADGVTTNVTVTIPTLGTKTLTAVPEGNLYRGTTTTFGLVDQYGEIMSLPKISHLHVNSIRGK